MTTILIGVDGTPAATRATEVGLALAVSMDAKVIFIHFSPLAEKLFEEDPENGPSQERLEEADPVLGEAAKAAKARGVAAELRIQDEHASKMIAADLAGLAEGVDAALVVVGNRGRSEVADVALGSVSHELLRMSSAPVVVVHAGKEKE
ncbi:MAG TPA: universal stress protein [Acidimicrobiales bacterium]|nr:universal stress protein [Acidimicrobiales bacterium]